MMDKLLNRKMIMFFVYLILLLPFFSVPYLTSNFNIIAKFNNLLILIDGIIIILMTIFNKSYSKIINYIVAYLGVLLLSSIINNSNVFDTLMLVFHNITLCLLFSYGIKNEKILFLKVVEFVLASLVILNFLSILVFPNGMYTNSSGYVENWILGYKNSHILYMFPLLIVSMMKSFYLKTKIDMKCIFYLIIAIISTLLVNNSTGIIGLGIIAIYMLFEKYLKYIKWLNLKNYFITYIILFFSIVILRLQNIFSFLVVDILKKDLTFTGRTYIWDSVLNSIFQKRLLGFGNLTFKYNSYIFTTHNTFLDIIFKSGYVGLLIYIIMLFVVIKEIINSKRSKIVNVISIVLFSLFIMMLTESYTITHYLYIFVIVYNIKKFTGEEVCKN